MTYVAPNFKLSIHALDSFDVKSREKYLHNLKELLIPIKDATEQDILNWHANTENDLINNLTTKLHKKVSSNVDIDPYVKFFLEKENAFDYLRKSAPQIYELVNRVISNKLSKLKFTGPYTTGDANIILRDEVENLTELLTNNVNNLAPESSNTIVFGTLSDWMMRCPLDFPPYRS